MNLPKFKNQKLKEAAFIHRSCLNENPTLGLSSNERLEFLGDAIISFVVSEYLYQKFPKHQEGDLTSFRAALVRTKSLASLAQKLELGNHLKLSRGEEETGGRQNPSILANTVEALVGALYLDQGMEMTKNFLQENLLPQIGEIIRTESYKDSKSRLQEIVQTEKRVAPIYKILKYSGPDHARQFTVGVYVENKLLGKGQGRSKQAAEEQAARIALEKWKNFC